MANNMEWYYVTALDRVDNAGIRDRYFPMSGPFDTKEEAELHVDAVRRYCESVDPRAIFMAWGVSKYACDLPGKLESLGINVTSKATGASS